MDDMSMKEILLRHHADELADHKKYLELAKEAYESDHECAAGVLEDIAHDEMTHAKAIEHILKKEAF